jgi:hypothetical protein
MDSVYLSTSLLISTEVRYYSRHATVDKSGACEMSLYLESVINFSAVFSED